MPSTNRHLCLPFTLVALLVQFSSSDALRAEQAAVDYLRDIKPLLARKCYGCHGSLKSESNLRLDTAELLARGGDSGPAIVKGDAAASLIMERVRSKDENERMPPEGEPLTQEQAEQLAEWINAGAAGPTGEKPQPSPETHWAFQPLSQPSQLLSHPLSIGGAADALTSGQQTLDFFITRRLNQAGLEMAPPADARTLVRRLHFTLHGLPPRPEIARVWIERLDRAATPSQRDRVVRRLVDELLASPRYGERWAQHWLDIVRYADTHGFEVNTPRPNAWPYRDYVIRAFNDDTPYDTFVREQLAGDMLGQDAATGFLVAAAVLLPGQIGKDDASKRLARQDALDEIVVGTSATFLGLTVGCARCHDHKFDPISQEDYYAMQAFFAGVAYGDREVKDVNDDRQRSIDQIDAQILEIQAQLKPLQPRSFVGETIIIDDEDESRTVHLAKKNGHGANPDGKQRGYRNDMGGADREPNLSQGRYTWWDNREGQDVFAWDLESAGDFRVWVSWGVHGSGVHTRDARYVLDEDGDLTTREDQREIAQADQYYFAGQTTGESERKPLWSGLQHTGVHHLLPNTKLVLRGGKTGTGITADVIVLQSVEELANEGAAEGAAEGDSASAPLVADKAGREARGLAPSLRAPVSPVKNIEAWAPIDAKFVRFTSLATIDNNKHEPCIDELEIYAADAPTNNLALASNGTIATSSGNYGPTKKHRLSHVNDGQYGNGKSWISNESGRGWVQLELPKTAKVESIVWGRDRQGKFKDRLAVRYRIETSLNGQDWTLVAKGADRLQAGSPHDPIATLLRHPSRADARARAPHSSDLRTPSIDVRQLAAKLTRLEAERRKLSTPRQVYGGVFQTPDTTRVLRRGDPEQPLDVVVPHTPVSIVASNLAVAKLEDSVSDASRRMVLARWLTDPAHPLVPRVIVNRVWQQHFGVGLVETSSDFGFNGASPSHPELLDYLARELIENRWSLKHLHRLIATSRTFQQASRIDSQALAKDGDTRLLWRFPTRRLEAEAIRDSILDVSGQLNLTMGGPGFDFFKSRGGLNGFPPLEQFTGNELRRMIYAHKVRMEPVPVFGAFDCPDAGQATPTRSQSTTAIQALNLLNSSFVNDQAEAMALRLEKEASSQSSGELDVSQAITAAFQATFSRAPTPVELKAATQAAKSHGLTAVCRALFNTNEFLFIP